MKVAILGYGDQGRAAYDYWGRDADNELTICDQNKELVAPEGALTHLGPDYLKHLDQFDVLVRSPGLHPRDIGAANSDAILTKVTTVTNEFLRVCPTFNIIGVTGTKGKGTTSTLITRMLESAGKKVHLGGNIGVPPLDMLNNKIQPDDWVQKSPHLAVCLLVVPEHLDWHKDLQEYITAKQQLFATQTTDDIAIFYADNENSKTVASAGQAVKIPYYGLPGAVVVDDYITIDAQKICRLDEIKLLGKHNWQNVCAAITAVWQVTQDVAALHSAIAAFDNFVLSPAASMAEIVAEAQSHAQPGDAVVLSPGFPSFDMFKNFEDRGLQFKAVVNDL
jgi:UDP-N-acetylmuramoylalanine--D-glutamate ligase